MPEPVIIVPYDAAWPRYFREIERRLRDALGDAVVDIHHVGSTSVPGLAAKAIIDVDMVIADDTFLPLATERLASAGYVLRGDLGIPGRYAFSPPTDLPRHHPYVCTQQSAELARHLAFRDFLRANPGEAADYAALKRELAEQYGEDRDGYSIAKTDFVQRILRLAMAP